MEEYTIDPEQIEKILKAQRANKQQRSLKLTPPTTYCAMKVSSFFEGDNDVFTVFNYKEGTLTIYVKGADKAEAINFLIKHKREICNQTMTVKVVHVDEAGGMEELIPPTYTITVEGRFSYMKSMMKGNPIEAEFNTVYDPIMDTMFYFCELDDRACRYKVDNLANPYGYECALPEDVMNYAFDTDGIFVSTLQRP